MRKELRFWNIPVMESLDNAVEDVVKSGVYVSKSDLVREAVREKLKELGISLTAKEKEAGSEKSADTEIRSV